MFEVPGLEALFAVDFLCPLQSTPRPLVLWHAHGWLTSVKAKLAALPQAWGHARTLCPVLPGAGFMTPTPCDFFFLCHFHVYVSIPCDLILKTYEFYMFIVNRALY